VLKKEEKIGIGFLVEREEAKKEKKKEPLGLLDLPNIFSFLNAMSTMRLLFL
jgi:hypothetical protein